MPYQPILATLGFVLSSDQQKTLMIYRSGRKPEDLHQGKYNGLGGKLKAGEHIVEGMKRELREEAQIEVLSLQLRGTISWPGFGKGGEDWFGFIFRITQFSGLIPSHNSEGSLHWIDLKKLPELPMWEGDSFFLPLIFDEDPRLFHGVMPYHGGKPLSWNFTRL